MISFKQFGLKEALVQAVEALGFASPTPIQQNTVPLLINEKTDIIALAQTGTGKTAAFGLPLLHRIEENNNFVQALVLSPTRELCIQIKDEMVKYSQFMDTSIVAVFGGASITEQIKNIRKGAQIIVATPGRLIDLINRKVIKLENVTTVVLDEADEMLNMGFREDIDEILASTASREEAWLFSATMNNDVRKIAKKFMNQPKEVAVAKENVGNENIEHQYYVTQGKYRYETLQRLLDFTPEIYGIIFTRTKQDAHDISEKLVKDGYMVSALHGDLDQKMRSKVMQRFKNKQLQVIVATDVAARGIDVNDITHVINFELPDDPEVYTHRSGRTARAGKKGICISITTPREISKIRRIEKIVNSKFTKMAIPGGKEVVRKKLAFFLESVNAAQPQAEVLNVYQAEIASQLDQLSKEELVERLLWMQLQQTIETYQNAPDLNMAIKEKENGSSSNNGSVRLFINLGKKDGLNAKKLADFLKDSIDFDPSMMERITVVELSSYFNVPADTSDYIVENLAKQKYNGRKIRVDEADEKPSRPKGDRGFRDASYKKEQRYGGGRDSGGGRRDRDRDRDNKWGKSGNEGSFRDRKRASSSEKKKQY